MIKILLFPLLISFLLQEGWGGLRLCKPSKTHKTSTRDIKYYDNNTIYLRGPCETQFAAMGVGRVGQTDSSLDSSCRLCEGTPESANAQQCVRVQPNNLHEYPRKEAAGSVNIDNVNNIILLFYYSGVQILLIYHMSCGDPPPHRACTALSHRHTHHIP